jgi:hypothetical protein
MPPRLTLEQRREEYLGREREQQEETGLDGEHKEQSTVL